MLVPMLVPVKGLEVRLLCDNSVRVGAKGIMGEHGFSALISSGGEEAILDTGQSGKVLINNLDAKGIEGPARVVLSHGHYDHSGGLMAYLARQPGCGPVTVYTHADAFGKRLKRAKGKLEDVSMPFSREQLEGSGARISESGGPQRVTGWLITSGIIERGNAFERPETEFFIEKGGVLEPDPFLDDMAVIANVGGKGLVIVTGCAHSGIVNTARHAMKLTKVERVYAIIGGFHLIDASPAKMSRTVDALREIDPSLIVTAHCTGKEAAYTLRREFGERVVFGEVGLRVSL